MPLGALAAGVLAGVGDLRTPIFVAGLLTLAAGGYTAVRLTDTRVDAAVVQADAAAAGKDEVDAAQVSGGRAGA